jgi:regulator of cell morphogenesis and NO signaling
MMLILKDKTVGEVAAEVPAAARVFEKHGIDYCCGGKDPIEGACSTRGIALDVLAQELERAAENTEPDNQDWHAAPLRDLIEHILTKHHAYLKTELPRLEQLFAKVVQAHGEREPSLALAQGVFWSLKEELVTHMMKEEMILFPAIVRLEAAAGGPGDACFGSLQNPITRMEFEHDNVGRALDDLRQHANDYQTPPEACNTYRELFRALTQLEADLHRHIHLENNILFPRAVEMEAR